MILCELMDCDANASGVCTDALSCVSPFRKSNYVTDPADCRSYNPVDKEGGADADRD